MADIDSNLFYLKWNNFSKIVSTQYELLRDAKSLTDVTFLCEGKRLEAHKLVLFACSTYFKSLIEEDLNTKHLVFFFSDVKYEIMKGLLEYMYMGEVHIRNEDLKEFIKVAEKLKIRGLDSTGQIQNDTDTGLEQLSRGSDESKSNSDSQCGDKKRPGSMLDSNNMKRVCGNEESGMIMTGDVLQQNTSGNTVPTTHSNVVSLDAETTTDKICTLLASKTITGHEIQGIEVDYPGSQVHHLPNMTNEFKTEDTWMEEQMQSPMTQGGDNSSNKGHKNSKLSASKRLSQCMTPTACQLCSRVYSNVSNLRQHMRLIHQPDPVICPICKKHFSSNLYLKRHYSSIHGGGGNSSSGDENLTSKTDNTPHHDWHIYDTKQ